MTDSFSPFDAVLAQAPPTDPWAHAAGEAPRYAPDYDLLGSLLTIPVAAGKVAASGAFANGVDAWLAYELRRAGFARDEVWPRPERPRILPRDVAALLERLPRTLADEVRARVARMPAVAPSSANILGRAYVKQVDVVMSRWDRGPELLVSTKTQVSSFGKNLPNRFEEAYGDAGNLRSRYPLAAVGFFFVQRSTILDHEPAAFEKTVDMMRKLRDVLAAGNGYTATGLALATWDDDDPAAAVRIDLDAVPADIRPEQFLTAMVQTVLSASPIDHHVAARERIGRRNLPVTGSEED
ncbi:hypothetical protein [Microbacterium sp.]|uniref:hypothetical protein n=1 Tax=Microbacterium sp. TaxID=51671 RepID=UPI0039E23B58